MTRRNLACDMMPPIGKRATLGLIALQTDETIEAELSQILTADGVTRLTSRVACSPEVTPETLRQMERDLPSAASLLPSSLSYDVIGYGCTSGATMIGSEAVADLIRTRVSARHVTDPLHALFAACRLLGVTKLGFVTPYVEEVTAAMEQLLTRHGLTITDSGSFGIVEDARVARVAPASIEQAVLDIGRSNCDAVFVSCTNLHALPVIASAEAALRRPVLASNQVLGWHMMRLAGIESGNPAHGRIFGV